jgi:hypothetical protein
MRVSNGQFSRRFHPGMVFHVGSIPHRIVYGEKPSGMPGEVDLRLDHKVTTPDGRFWLPVPMALAFLYVDFFTENEEVLYPWPKKGAGKFTDACHVAIRDGWQKSGLVLDEERAEKQRRLDEGETA